MWANRVHINSSSNAPTDSSHGNTSCPAVAPQAALLNDSTAEPSVISMFV